MCLKVVIEYQVKDANFAQEKYIFSMYIDTSLIPLDLSRILVFSQISKNQLLKKAYSLFVLSSNWDPFEPVFKGPL